MYRGNCFYDNNNKTQLKKKNTELWSYSIEKKQVVVSLVGKIDKIEFLGILLYKKQKFRGVNVPDFISNRKIRPNNVIKHSFLFFFPKEM